MCQAVTLAHTFLISNLPIRELQEQAELVLACEDLSEVIQVISPQDKERLVDKLHQVWRIICCLFSSFSYILHKGIPDC